MALTREYRHRDRVIVSALVLVFLAAHALPNAERTQRLTVADIQAHLAADHHAHTYRSAGGGKQWRSPSPRRKSLAHADRAATLPRDPTAGDLGPSGAAAIADIITNGTRTQAKALIEPLVAQVAITGPTAWSPPSASPNPETTLGLVPLLRYQPQWSRFVQ
ncbi:hypothetical protein [Nocardia sp. NPDC057030]|uniref:hypothetical protein n=1 Tax=unclassified Nocardia TaxID=2637762 RepID=UPI00363F5AED